VYKRQIYYRSSALRDTIKAIALDENIHSLVLHIDELKYWKQILAEELEGFVRKALGFMMDACEYARDEIKKPVMICVSLETYSEDEEDRKYHLMVKKEFESRGFPVYPTLEGAIKSLFNLHKYRTLLLRT